MARFLRPEKGRFQTPVDNRSALKLKGQGFRDCLPRLFAIWAAVFAETDLAGNSVAILIFY